MEKSPSPERPNQLYDGAIPDIQIPIKPTLKDPTHYNMVWIDGDWVSLGG